MRTKKYSYVAVFDREEDGRVIASAPGVPGAHVYGRTRKETLTRLRTVLRFYVREARRLGFEPADQHESALAEIEVMP